MKYDTSSKLAAEIVSTNVLHLPVANCLLGIPLPDWKWYYFGFSIMDN